MLTGFFGMFLIFCFCYERNFKILREITWDFITVLHTACGDDELGKNFYGRIGCIYWKTGEGSYNWTRGTVTYMSLTF